MDPAASLEPKDKRTGSSDTPSASSTSLSRTGKKRNSKRKSRKSLNKDEDQVHTTESSLLSSRSSQLSPSKGGRRHSKRRSRKSLNQGQDPPPQSSPNTIPEPPDDVPPSPPLPQSSPPPKWNRSSGGAFRKIWLLLWKNLLYRRRHYVITTLEIILPTILALCLALLFHYRDPKLPDPELTKLNLTQNPVHLEHPHSRFKRSIQMDDRNQFTDGLNIPTCRVGPRCVIAIAPKDNAVLNKVIEHAISRFPPPQHDSSNTIPGLIRKGSEWEIEDYVYRRSLKQLKDSYVESAIIFDNDIDQVLQKSDNPNHVQTFHYSLRSGDSRNRKSKALDQRPGQFEALQRTVEGSLIHEIMSIKGVNRPYQINVKSLEDTISNERWKPDRPDQSNNPPTSPPSPEIPFTPPPLNGNPVSKPIPPKPKPSQPSSPFTPQAIKDLYNGETGFSGEARASFAAIFVGMGFIFIVPSIMKGVVNERETGIKELMKLSGIPNWIHWFAWTINFVVLFSITVTIVVLLLFFVEQDEERFLWNCDIFLLWCLLWLYVFASTTFCFFLSSFFPQPMHAITFGVIIWLVTAVGPSAALLFEYELYSTSEKMGMALTPNAALFFIFRIVIEWETKGEPINGANFGNVFKKTDGEESEDTFTLGLVAFMLVVDIVLYFFLTLYFEAVLPSEYGLRKPFYFLFMPSYWGCSKKAAPGTTVGPELGSAMIAEEQPGFEREPEGLSVGVDIRNMRKVFGRHAAVDGVSLKMFHGEIFALLGHNGAGKTTTISCCIGMMAPTGGTAIINKFDIVSQMDRVREQLGVCPQHNLLFDELTVDQHLKFFGKLKGMSSAAATAERMEMLRKLQLVEKTHTMAKNLSGGQKRKLCLGIALIGNAKVVFLDEPTSGMDVEARRAIWDLLLSERGHRTIILTTHFMEEADVLGDRIGIMAHGKVQCCGTSMFLKKYYGTGYTLIMTMLDQNPEKWNGVLMTVQVLVPTATFKEDPHATASSNQLDINLPTDSCSTSTFSKLFKSLQEKKLNFGIQTMGLSLTTMDEVFIKVDEAYSLKSGKFKLVPEPSIIPSGQKGSFSRPPPSLLVDGKVTEVITPDHAPVKEPAPIANDPKITASSSPSQSTVQPTNTMQTSQISDEKGPSIRKPQWGGILLVFVQFAAFIIKRFHYTRRKWKLFFCQVAIPVSLAFLAVYCGNATLSSPVPPLDKNTDVDRPQIYGFDAYPGDDKITYFRDSRPAGTLHPNQLKPILGSSVTRLAGTGTFESDLFQTHVKYEREWSDTKFYDKHFVALELKENEINAYYAGDKYRWMALNMANNLFLHSIGIFISLEMTEGPPLLEDFSIPDLTDPLKESPITIVYNFPIFGLFIPTALAILAATLVVAPIEEKICNAKQLQIMTGVSPGTYWTATFLWDFTLMAAVSMLMLFVIMACQKRDAYTTHPGGGVLLLIMLVFIYAAIPFSYLFTLVVGSVAGGFGAVASIHILMVLLGFVSGSFMEGAEIQTLYVAAAIFRVFGSIFPCFGLTMCLIKYVAAALRKSKCNFLSHYAKFNFCDRDLLRVLSGNDVNDVPEKSKLIPPDPTTKKPIDIFQCCGRCEDFRDSFCVQNRKYMEWDMKVTSIPLDRGVVVGLSQEILYLFNLGTIYILILIIWEVVIAPRRSKGGYGGQMHHEPNPDEDVEDEAQRANLLVYESRAYEDALVVHNFSKTYGTFAAVNDINFGLHYGECFGLLGVNGAGKTTTFRMLTGDETRTSGNAYISGIDLTKSKTKFLGKIGYCPQFDAIIGVLTGLEMVALFGRLRGVKEVNKVSREWMIRVGLTDNENEKCRNYSGGMKRRLSAAMALIGDPEIILLDEPTSGVDPVSRRQFWKIILSTKAEGRAIVLTSHSMDEITACCTRLAIMVNGRLQCLGGVQYLKNKFAQGFSLDLKLRTVTSEEELASLDREILEKLAPCTLKDSHATALQYHIQDPLAPWDILFSRMEEIKEKYATLIEDYSITETTLEQVFLAFARMQYPARTAPGGGCKCFK